MTMLRCTAIGMVLAGCATAPAPDASGPAEATVGPGAVAQQPETAAEPASEEEITRVIVESETFTYSMTLKRPDSDDPRILCSYGRRTGSHFYQKYCRTEEVSQQERDAAREFFDEARRRGN